MRVSEIRVKRIRVNQGLGVGVFPVKLIDRGCCCWQSWPLLSLQSGLFCMILSKDCEAFSILNQ